MPQPPTITTSIVLENCHLTPPIIGTQPQQHQQLLSEVFVQYLGISVVVAIAAPLLRPRALASAPPQTTSGVLTLVAVPAATVAVVAADALQARGCRGRYLLVALHTKGRTANRGEDTSSRLATI